MRRNDLMDRRFRPIAGMALGSERSYKAQGQEWRRRVMRRGRCHCGRIQYEMPDEVLHHALCHCSDCRRHAGAPMVGWAMVAADQVSIVGTPQTYKSSEHGRRLFCGDCGTGLFYINEEMLPGLIDVQTGTLDEPNL